MLKAKDKNGILVYIDDADPTQQYYCQVCDQPVMQKRGEIRIHHFSHYSPHGTHANLVPCCDHWSYDMTEWHMEWQKRFSLDDVEKVLTIGKEKHIADLLVNEIIVEFQHSAISLEDFNERNEFYTKLGYKVIWVFDLIEEFENGRIKEEFYEGTYKWSFVKKLFRELDLKETKATIYFQFSDCEDEECGVLERVKTLSDEGRNLKTDSSYALSIKDFVQYIKENSSRLFERPKPIPATQLIENHHTIKELWSEKYSKMIVRNNSDNSIIFIYGKDGKMIRDYTTGKIRCSFAYQDWDSGYYVPKKQFYNVVGENKKIWSLIHGFEDKNYNKQTIENNETSIDVKEIIGCQSLDEIISKNTAHLIAVENMDTHKRYCLQLVGSLKNFNIYEIDSEHLSVKINEPLNAIMFKQYKNKIWKFIPFSEIFN